LTGPRLSPARRWARDDRGSAASELVVLAVVAFMFVAVIVFAGRMNVGYAHTEAAARAAARTISLARDPETARTQAEDQASRIVDEGSAMCTEMGFEADIGLEDVTVEITCTVDLEQAALAEVPGTRTVTADATEAIDPYREGT
jgi:Flp pilus assembly protein TadG